MNGLKTKMHQRLQALTTVAPLTAKQVPSISAATEQRLVAILVTPVLATETALVGNARKEREVAGVFAGLTVIEAWWLHKRLLSAAPGDALVVAFARLVTERRQRLLAFLADARRRAAINKAA